MFKLIVFMNKSKPTKVITALRIAHLSRPNAFWPKGHEEEKEEKKQNDDKKNDGKIF